MLNLNSLEPMGSIISKIADEIALHGSYEAYEKFRDKEEKEEDIPYFPDPEVVPRVHQQPNHNFATGGYTNSGAESHMNNQMSDVMAYLIHSQFKMKRNSRKLE